MGRSGHRSGDVNNPRVGVAAEVRGVGELQHLRRHRHVGLHDPRDVSHARLSGRQQLGQLAVHPWCGGQRRRSRGAAIELDPRGHLLERAGALDHCDESIRVARLGQQPMGDRGRARDHLHFSLSGEDDPDGGRIQLAHPRQQPRAVDLGHAHVGDDDVVGLARQLIERLVRAADEAHRPGAALRP